MVICIAVAFLLVTLGSVIGAGKGDWLIAGYNTASSEEKEKVNIKRLRRVVVAVLDIVAFAMLILCVLPDEIGVIVFPVVVIIVVTVGLIAANTWAKKGKNSDDTF